MSNAEYQSLLKRVAEFNAIEQKLINTRDELDKELDTYKRLAKFSTQALDLNTTPELLLVAAEAIIDIFELEGAIVALRSQLDNTFEFFSEGNIEKETARQMLEGLVSGNFTDSAKGALILNSDCFGNEASLSIVHHAILFRHIDNVQNYQLILFGFVSKANSKTYKIPSKRDKEVFNILAHNTLMMLDRILDKRKMWDQLQTIKESEKKLKTLSVIATKSKNGVVISDRNGLITWVNDSFEHVTGYSLNEVIGRAPGSILQGPATDPRTVQRMSDNISAGKGIATQIVNYTKNGHLLHIDLEIIPVAAEDGSITGFVALQQDITKQKEYITDLSNAHLSLLNTNEELKKTNSELDILVYRISHDLRAPLLSVKGLIGIMEDEPINETTADYLKLMLMSINRIDESIINILHYSRNTRLKVTYELVDMKEMITGIMDELKYLPGHTIETSLEIEGPATIYTDKQRLGTMLTNLISNAFKYSQHTEHKVPFVKISICSDNHQITIKIEDNGEGIAPEHQSKIFDMFYRASSSNVGSGLGLYICKEMAAKMGGTISVSSQKNTGTTFTVVLPVVAKVS